MRQWTHAAVSTTMAFWQCMSYQTLLGLVIAVVEFCVLIW